MKTRLPLLAALISLVLSFQPLLAQDCAFQLGFKALHDLIPDVVGDCLDDEQHNSATGLTQQNTANGRLTWRKADNWTGFTDGQRTWINGPQGLQQRLNSERLPWEPEMTAPAATQRLTLEQLRNAEYRLPLLGDQDTPIRLVDGMGTLVYGEGATERETVGLVNDTVAFGDLDGDGIADAAVVVFISGGGSGTFIHLVAVLDRDGAPEQAAWAFLGDRVPVRSLTIAGGQIVARTVTHRPSDGLCCPTLEITRTFELEGDQLVPRQALVIESPLPGETVANGVEVRGTASTYPSAESLAYSVYDARGGVIGMGSLPVDGYADQPGTFAAPVEFIAGADGPGRIEIVDINPVDGSALARTAVSVILQAAPLTDGRTSREPTPELVLESPLSGTTVGTTVELRGRISALPFEKNLTYRIYTQAGTVIDQSWISVEGDYGGPGTFARSIDIPGTTAPGLLRIEVRDESVVDGALIGSTSVEVRFTGGP
ncbi:MAG: hypothetical protein OXO54_13680 [Chloroflexota bacterium]|nr:hypothetical protein [bacterium]MDE2766466.1 hypothetical protein [Chloroflexota bacterium]MDE2899361.1 hypothetical protein [Chloroflexota bacterium]